MSGSTQEQGHIFDVVLSPGTPIFNLEVYDAVFSDHIPVLFHVTFACYRTKPCAADGNLCIINPSTAPQFLSLSFLYL